MCVSVCVCVCVFVGVDAGPLVYVCVCVCVFGFVLDGILLVAGLCINLQQLRKVIVSTIQTKHTKHPYQRVTQHRLSQQGTHLIQSLKVFCLPMLEHEDRHCLIRLVVINLACISY